MLGSLRRVIKTQIADRTLRVSGLVGLGRYLRICFSNEFPGETNAADQEAHFKNHRLTHNQKGISWGGRKGTGDQNLARAQTLNQRAYEQLRDLLFEASCFTIKEVRVCKIQII